MPIMANIVLDDANEPAVSRTFKPMSLRNDIGIYSNETGGAVKTWPTLSISTRPASTNNQGHKTILKIVLPLVPVDDPSACCVPSGTPQPASIVTVEFLRNSISSTLDAETLLEFLQQAVLDTQFTACALGESLR